MKLIAFNFFELDIALYNLSGYNNSVFQKERNYIGLVYEALNSNLSFQLKNQLR